MKLEKEIAISLATKELFDTFFLDDYGIDYYYVLSILNDHFGHLFEDDKYE